MHPWEAAGRTMIFASILLSRLVPVHSIERDPRISSVMPATDGNEQGGTLWEDGTD